MKKTINHSGNKLSTLLLIVVGNYTGSRQEVYKIKKAVRIPPNFLTISYEKP